MTRADDYRNEIHYVRKYGSIEQKLEYAESFFDRTWPDSCKITDFKVTGSSVQFKVTRWGEDDEFTVHLNGSRWYCGEPCSDARIAEVLGVSSSYINGLVDAFELITDTVHYCEWMLQSLQKKYMDATKAFQDSIALEGSVCYPPVPKPMADPESNDLPTHAGVYFVWNCDAVVYVGQAINIKKRCNLRHHAITHTDRLSFVEIDKAMLTWAESYYIGLLRPIRNGGTHHRYDTALAACKDCALFLSRIKQKRIHVM